MPGDPRAVSENLRRIRKRRKQRRYARYLFFSALGVALIVLVAIGDFIWPGADWWAEHSMVATAVTTLVTFFGVSICIQRVIDDRKADQLDRISTVAYRSLAQVINDAGRSLLVPLVGADLRYMAVPSTWNEPLRKTQRRLRKLGYSDQFSQVTGSWDGIKREGYDEVLLRVLAEPGVPHLLFECAAQQRRKLHEATALWAPVMLLGGETTADMGSMRRITDAMENLQERARDIQAEERKRRPNRETLQRMRGEVSTYYWRAIEAYVALRNDFGTKAELPSDESLTHRARPI